MNRASRAHVGRETANAAERRKPLRILGITRLSLPSAKQNPSVAYFATVGFKWGGQIRTSDCRVMSWGLSHAVLMGRQKPCTLASGHVLSTHAVLLEVETTAADLVRGQVAEDGQTDASCGGRQLTEVKTTSASNPMCDLCIGRPN